MRLIHQPIPETGKLESIDQTHEHTEAAPALIWTITHNMLKKPSVVAYDGGGVEIVGEVAYPNNYTVTITFLLAKSGTAYLN